MPAFFAISCDNFVASAVITNGIAKRQMEVKREGALFVIAPVRCVAVVLLAEFFMERHCRWIRRVTRPAAVIFFYKGFIPDRGESACFCVFHCIYTLNLRVMYEAELSVRLY